MLKTLLGALVLIAGHLPAQQRFHAGIKAGLSTSQVHGDTLSGFHKAGLAAGAYLDARLKEQLNARFELLFVQKGSKKPFDPNSSDYSFYLMKLNYIEVPVLLEYSYKKFQFTIGPGFGYLINATEEDFYGTVNTLIPFESYEISGHVGLSFRIIGNLRMDWRYSNSLLPVRKFKDPVVAARYDSGQRNNVLAFTLNYTFGGADE